MGLGVTDTTDGVSTRLVGDVDEEPRHEAPVARPPVDLTLDGCEVQVGPSLALIIDKRHSRAGDCLPPLRSRRGVWPIYGPPYVGRPPP